MMPETLPSSTTRKVIDYLKNHPKDIIKIIWVSGLLFYGIVTVAIIMFAIMLVGEAALYSIGAWSYLQFKSMAVITWLRVIACLTFWTPLTGVWLGLRMIPSIFKEDGEE